MIVVYIIQYNCARVQTHEAADVFAGFGYKYIAVSETNAAREEVYHAADVDGRVYAGVFCDTRQHRRDGCLAVAAGYADDLIVVCAYHTQELRAFYHHYVMLNGVCELGVCGFDSGSVDDERGVFGVGFVVTDFYVDSGVHESFCERGLFYVAAVYIISQIAEDLSQPAHRAAADSYKMYLFVFIIS